MYYSWRKQFLETGKRRLMGDTKLQATSGEVMSLRKQNSQLKELVADLSLKNVVLKRCHGPRCCGVICNYSSIDKSGEKVAL